MIILEEIFKWHLEAFASELFIYIYIYILAKLWLICGHSKHYSEVSRDFLCSQSRLWFKIFSCVGCCLSHYGTPHTIGAKWFNLGFFLLVCGLSHFENLIRCKKKKSFGVYPA